MNLPQLPLAPNDSASLWTTRNSRTRITGTWRTRAPEYRSTAAPCLAACPVNGTIARWIGEVRAGNLRRAWELLVENNPFPAIAGRICHHPCESACNRQKHDESVSICALERHVGDAALAAGWAYPKPATERRKRIAIVGGGPAGLSAAYQLRRRGLQVTLFESRPELGGLLRYGIPDYRLDKRVLDGEVRRIVDLGVEVRRGAMIESAAALAELRAQFDAVFLATGATRSRALPGLDYGQPWVVDGADFLAAANAGEAIAPGARVVVIGGGSAAMDVARTARRLGREVSVLALEAEGALPAQRIEVDEALEEDVRFVCGAMLQRVEPADQGLVLHCVRVAFEPGATRGEFKVTPIEGSAFTLAADLVVPSIGQSTDLERWRGLLEAAGPVIGVDRGFRTSAEGVFAGGDVASLQRFFTEAVGMGKKAAIEIDAYVSGEAAPNLEVGATVPFDQINTSYHPRAPRQEAPIRGVAERLGSFAEVQGRLDDAAAQAEAQRCFSCGSCTQCDNCYFYCPDAAIERTETGYTVRYDHCKGCGLCVEECPTGAVLMRNEERL